MSETDSDHNTSAANSTMDRDHSDSDSDSGHIPFAHDDSPPPQPTELTLAGVWRHTRLHIDSNPVFQLDTGGGRIALCGIFLGLVFGSGFILAILSPACRQFGIYMVMMATFHILEFIWTAIFHPNKLSATCEEQNN